MKYRCELCNYDTNRKFCYERHLDSEKHRAHSYAVANGIRVKKQHIFRCDKCGKKYSHQPSLSRHRKQCKDGSNQKRIKELEDKLYNATLEDARKQGEIRALLKMVQATKQSNPTSKKSCTYNFIQVNMPNGNPLVPIKNYNCLNKGEPDILVDDLDYFYRRGLEANYLGDYVVECYKKDNPIMQSVWNSDTERLTYHVCILLKNNESIWRRDPDGNKFRECVIDPMLVYVRKILKDYIKEGELKLLNLPQVDDTEYAHKLNTLTKLIDKIDSGLVGRDILKYVAPMFYLSDEIRKDIPHYKALQDEAERERKEFMNYGCNSDDLISDSAESVPSSSDSEEMLLARIINGQKGCQ